MKFILLILGYTIVISIVFWSLGFVEGKKVGHTNYSVEFIIESNKMESITNVIFTNP